MQSQSIKYGCRKSGAYIAEPVAQGTKVWEDYTVVNNMLQSGHPLYWLKYSILWNNEAYRS